MARKTKEEALATRNSLLDAAEHVFAEQGVARTSLHEIASRAGLTRGAIYWHFANKSELITAMWQRAALPMQQAIEAAERALERNPLERIRQCTCWIARQIETDVRIRTVMTIILIRCEFTEETRTAHEHLLNERDSFLARVRSDFDQAVTLGQLAPSINTEQAAFGIMALIDGLCMHWLSAPNRFSIHETLQQTIDAYLGGLSILAKA